MLHGFTPATTCLFSHICVIGLGHYSEVRGFTIQPDIPQLIDLELLNSLRGRLNEELKSRRVRNPRYSLRSYARFLELDPSYLSKLLKSKRVLHPAMAQHCALKLGWTDFESNSVTGQTLRDSYRTLDVDAFHLISQWHHYAIFELLKVKRSWNEQKIAEAFGIDRSVAIDAIGRLLRLGVIKKTSSGFSRG